MLAFVAEKIPYVMPPEAGYKVVSDKICWRGVGEEVSFQTSSALFAFLLEAALATASITDNLQLKCCWTSGTVGNVGIRF